MWTFLLDPATQGLALFLALGGLAFVGWDLYDGSSNASAASRFAPRRRAPRPERVRPTGRMRAEPCVDSWIDPQGRMCGRVRRGPAKGARLEDMSRETAEAQLAYARDNDPASTATLEALIRQIAGASRPEPPGRGKLSRAAALTELGLSEGASEADIHAAYRRLIKAHHPDHGGSHAKAARINEARDLLAG